jgi:hypothetical protein
MEAMKIMKFYSTILDLEKEIKTSKGYMSEYNRDEVMKMDTPEENDIFEAGYQTGIKYALNKLNEVK